MAIADLGVTRGRMPPLPASLLLLLLLQRCTQAVIIMIAVAVRTAH